MGRKERNRVGACGELTVSEAEAFDMVKSGKLDALVTIDGFGDPEKAVPVCKDSFP